MIDDHEKTVEVDPGEQAAEAQGSSIEQEASQVLDDLEGLRVAAEERDKYLDLLKRTRADFENYQKRVQRDQQEERRYALKPLAADLLPALDNLDRALAAAQEHPALSEGIRLVQTEMLEAFKRHGVSPIEAEGKPFDPNYHQAMMQEASAEQPPGTVLRVLETGFVYHDRVLRPSKVIVSKAE